MMIQKKIADIDNDMSVLRKCSNILFDHWKDGNADNFNSAIVQGIENQYQSFNQEVRGIDSEINRLHNEIEQSNLDIHKTAYEIEKLCQNPSIHGCFICQAFGTTTNDFTEERKYFVLSPDEYNFINDQKYLFEAARTRCRGLNNIKKVTFESNL